MLLRPMQLAVKQMGWRVGVGVRGYLTVYIAKRIGKLYSFPTRRGIQL